MAVVQFWWVVVSGKQWNHNPLTWKQAEKKREELRAYYGPNVPIHLESVTTHDDAPVAGG